MDSGDYVMMYGKTPLEIRRMICELESIRGKQPMMSVSSLTKAMEDVGLKVSFDADPRHPLCRLTNVRAAEAEARYEDLVRSLKQLIGGKIG